MTFNLDPANDPNETYDVVPMLGETHGPKRWLEGVSKHRDRAYRAGRSPYWVKVKNRKHPAMDRVKEALASQ